MSFTVSDREMQLRKKLGVEGEPKYHPVFRFMQHAAFWQHWNLHKRTCDKTGRQIVSVFSQECSYPVWHKDEWVKSADPPGAEFDASKEVFPQMWAFFRCSPIAHNMGAGNENCEYTDDWWYGKNCYLCHSGHGCEDLRYCYRTVSVKNSQYCVFSFDSERCRDLIFSHNCFQTLFAFNCWQCSDSAFLYDCRNCSNCILCSNLRNKSYCIENVQYSKEEYEKKRAAYGFSSRKTYDATRAEFLKMLRERAWHRALSLDLSENVTGNYLFECKDCENCFFVTNDVRDCVNVTRSGVFLRDILDGISMLGAELVYCSTCVQDQCYDVKFGYNLIQCRFMEYCAHCFQCENCFGCCGLASKKYCIFNKQYSPEEYKALKARIIAKMKETKEYGQFFPGHFAANPYDESLAGTHWPLTRERAEKMGFWMSAKQPARPGEARDTSEIPDRSDDAGGGLATQIFWDDVASRPFQIQEADIEFAKSLGCPLPNSTYARRLQENFRIIPFDGTTHSVRCAKCGTATQTSWPKEYAFRVLCEGCYLKEVY